MNKLLLCIAIFFAGQSYAGNFFYSQSTTENTNPEKPFACSVKNSTQLPVVVELYTFLNTPFGRALVPTFKTTVLCEKSCNLCFGEATKFTVNGQEFPMDRPGQTVCIDVTSK